MSLEIDQRIYGQLIFHNIAKVSYRGDNSFFVT